LLADTTPGALRALDKAFATYEKPFANLWF
jgi:hypothetical protein